MDNNITVSTVNWNFGNFNVTVDASAEVVGEAAALLLAAAALQILQRGPAGKAEKRLAGGTWPVGKRGDSIRPPEFKRDSIAFTAERAAIVQECFTFTHDLAPDGEAACPLTFRCTAVTERVAADSVDSKFTEEKAILARHVAAGDVESWATVKLGFKGELRDDSGDPTVAFLKAIRTAKLALEAQIKAGL